MQEPPPTQDTDDAPQAACCVCGTPVSAPFHTIGGRAYCDRHFALVNKQHMGFWRSALLQIVIMGLFSAVVAFAADYIGPLEDPWRIPVGVLLVLIPAVAWLVYFYLQDRLEPEPKTRIIEVFLLAAVLTEAVGFPLLRLFQIDEWAASLTLTSLFASILIAGFTWQAINYAAVRVVVYATDEFDERMDGLVYGTVAGLGIGTVLNLHYVLDNGGVALAAGVVSIVTTTLAQASFGGITGYFMAQAKFERRPGWWVPAGVVVSAVLNGIYRWLVSEVSAVGLSVAPWRSLVFGLVTALVAFGVLLFLMRQAMRSTVLPPAAVTTAG